MSVQLTLPKTKHTHTHTLKWKREREKKKWICKQYKIPIANKFRLSAPLKMHTIRMFNLFRLLRTTNWKFHWILFVPVRLLCFAFWILFLLHVLFLFQSSANLIQFSTFPNYLYANTLIANLNWISLFFLGIDSDLH